MENKLRVKQIVVETVVKFLQESNTYRELEDDLKNTFEKTGIAKRCYNGEIVVSGSAWPIEHPNGSINITFWLMQSVPTDKLIKVAKEWAAAHNLIAATSYKTGIITNENPIKTQNWKNKAAQSCNFIYGFAFYSESYSLKNIYTSL